MGQEEEIKSGGPWQREQHVQKLRGGKTEARRPELGMQARKERAEVGLTLQQAWWRLGLV